MLSAAPLAFQSSTKFLSVPPEAGIQSVMWPLSSVEASQLGPPMALRMHLRFTAGLLVVVSRTCVVMSKSEAVVAGAVEFGLD